MKSNQQMHRRRFIQGSMALFGAGSVAAKSGLGRAASLPQDSPSVAPPAQWRFQAAFDSGQTFWILTRPDASFQEQLASRELARGLRNLGLARAPIQAAVLGAQPGPSDSVFSLTLEREGFKHPEAYEIAREPEASKPLRARLTGATPQAVLYAVFDFLERQGAFFGLEGEVYPLEPVRSADWSIRRRRRCDRQPDRFEATTSTAQLRSLPTMSETA
jgi:hypothetical protein